MQIKAKEIVLVPVGDLKFNPENYNKHPEEQIIQLAKIITYQGFRRPITISKRSGFVNCGEGRSLAAKLLGMTHVPAMFQDYENIFQEEADAVADNNIDKQSVFDKKAFSLKFAAFQKDFDKDFLGIKNVENFLHIQDRPVKEKELDENIKTDHECPSCGYVW